MEKKQTYFEPCRWCSQINALHFIRNFLFPFFYIFTFPKCAIWEKNRFLLFPSERYITHSCMQILLIENLHGSLWRIIYTATDVKRICHLISSYSNENKPGWEPRDVLAAGEWKTATQMHGKHMESSNIYAWIITKTTTWKTLISMHDQINLSAWKKMNWK